MLVVCIEVNTSSPPHNLQKAAHCWICYELSVFESFSVSLRTLKLFHSTLRGEAEF